MKSEKMKRSHTSTLSNSSRGKNKSFFRQSLNSNFNVVDPQANVVQSWLMNLGGFVGINRLHNVNLYLMNTRSQIKNIFVDILFLQNNQPQNQNNAISYVVSGT